MNRANDLTFAFRMLRRRPWFSAAIVVTLALGIGINTTVFSLVNAVLFKPLPFQGGDRLVIALESNPSAGQSSTDVSYADFQDFREGARSFANLEAFTMQATVLGETGIPPERFRGARITPGMFAMLHTQPILGRGLLADDQKPGATLAIVIGYQVWKQRYGSNPNVIGRVVRAQEKPAVIVGVMPQGFAFPNHEDLWMPAIPDAKTLKRDARNYRMAGMLKRGVSIAEARADLDRTAARLAQTYPTTNKGFIAKIQTFHEAMNGGTIRTIFLLMLGAVGFVLLIACANVANMLLGRAVERHGEISVRSALGASRWRLVRQLLIESVVLSAVGGVLGLGLAVYGTQAFGRAVEDVGKPYWIDFSMNYAVFGYFSALTILAGVIFGIAPALLASRVSLNETLKGTSRNSAGARSGYLSGALVVLQFTLAVVLLSGAGLMLRSFIAANSEFAEMNPNRILNARVNLTEERYPKPEDRSRFFAQLLPRLSALPGVKAVAIASNSPGDGAENLHFETAEKPIPEAAKRPLLSEVIADPGYLPLLNQRILRGRNFDATDGLPGRETVIVSQRFAASFFPNRDPLGKQLRIYDDDGKPRTWMTIVGIAPDIRQQDPSENSSGAVVFVPYRANSSRYMAILLRTDAAPASLAAGLRTHVQQLDQDLALYDVMALSEKLDRSRWYLRVFGTLFFIFAAVAIGMAAMGVYGVMAHAASRRTREIGVRLALGSSGGRILRLVLRRGLAQLSLGMVLGLGAALAVCRLMGRLLFGVSPHDPLTFTVVAGTLAVIGITAIWLPARRAARLNPIQALRHQ